MVVQNLSSLETVGKAVSKGVPTKFNVKAARLEDFLTRSAVPSLGLHLAIVSSVALFDQHAKMFSQLYWIFALVVLSIGVSYLVRGHTHDNIIASRQATAAFCSLVLFIRGLAEPMGGRVLFEPLVFYLWLTTVFGIVCLLCMRGWIRPLSLVVIAIYVQIFAGILAPATSGKGLISVAMVVILAGSFALQRANALQYLIGLLVSGLVAVAVLVGRGSVPHLLESLAGFGVVLLVGFVIYELVTRKTEYSDAILFLAQALPVGIIYFIVITLAPDQWGIGIKAMMSAILFSGYVLFVWLLLRQRGLATRLLWLVVTWAFAIHALGLFNISSSLIMMSAVLVALVIAQIFQSGFLRGLATLFALGLVIFGLEANIFSVENAAGKFIQVIGDVDDVNTDPDVFRVKAIATIHRAVLFYALALVVAFWPAILMRTAWWRGLIRPRYVLIMRNLYRGLAKQISSIPIIGWVIGVFVAIWRALSYLKDNGKINLSDLLTLLTFASLAFVTTIWLQLATLSAAIDGGTIVSPFAGVWAWPAWGIMLALIAVYRGGLMYRLIGFFFMLVPVVAVLTEVSSSSSLLSWLPSSKSKPEIALIAFVLAFLPIFLSSLLPLPKADRAGRT